MKATSVGVGCASDFQDPPLTLTVSVTKPEPNPRLQQNLQPNPIGPTHVNFSLSQTATILFSLLKHV